MLKGSTLNLDSGGKNIKVRIGDDSGQFISMKLMVKADL